MIVVQKAHALHVLATTCQFRFPSHLNGWSLKTGLTVFDIETRGGSEDGGTDQTVLMCFID